MAANPFSRFVYDKIIVPVQAERQPVTKAGSAFAYGVGASQVKTLAQCIGQTPDVNYQPLYAIALLNADVAACVRRWAGGVTGNGWHLGLMDKGAEPNRRQRRELDELTRWLKNPNPSKRFSLLLYELIEHLAIAGDAYLEKVKDPQGRILELRGIHPITMRVEADEYGVVEGYVQQIGGNKETFKADQVSHLRLPNAHNDLYGASPMLTALEEIGPDLQCCPLQPRHLRERPQALRHAPDGRQDERRSGEGGCHSDQGEIHRGQPRPQPDDARRG
jgi:hypothetical protein